MLYSTGKSAQYSAMAYIGETSLKKRVDICVCITDYFAIHLKQTRHCNQLYAKKKILRQINKNEILHMHK